MLNGNSLHSNKLRANTLRTNKAVKFSRQKSGKDSKGISFRKSHNNLPIMHPDEIYSMQNSKKKKKNLYKQRASYSAAHFSRNKNQLLTQYNNNNKSLYNHNIYSKKKMHDKDEEFLNSLIEPVKKRELNEAIEKLKQVIESSSLTNLIGSTIEMSLREVLRKLQLLRLDVTLREYRKSGTKSLHTTDDDDDDDDTTDDDHDHNDKTRSAKLVSINGYKQKQKSKTKPSLLKPQSNPIKKVKSKSVENLPKIQLSSDEENNINDKQREKENKRILNVLTENKEQDGSSRDSSLVSALLFAAKHQHNQHFHPSIKIGKNNDTRNKQKIPLKECRKSGTKSLHTTDDDGDD